MEKRFAASAAIYKDGKVLLAKRAATKFPFPNEWSLPSTYITKDGELVHEPVPEEEMKRQLAEAIKRKLGVDVELVAVFGAKDGVQADYHLTMTDFVGKVVGGEISLNGEDFSEAGYFDPREKFGDEPKGFCSQVLMERLKEDKDFWKRYI